MYKRIRILGLVLMLLAVMGTPGGATGERKTVAPPFDPDAALMALPPSDVIAFVDARRALGESLPGVLAAYPQLLANLNSKLDHIKQARGIDPASFESFAFGLRLAPSPGMRPAGVVIARGSFDAAALISGQLKYEGDKHGVRVEEQPYLGKTIYVVYPPARRSPAGQGQPGVTPNDSPERTGSSLSTGHPKHEGGRRPEAVAMLDPHAVAFGDPDSVRAAMAAAGGGARVDDGLIKLATATDQAIVGFSGNVPASVAQKLGGVNNPMGRSISGLQQFNGAVKTTGGDAEVQVTLRMGTAGQAIDLSQLLNALRLVGRGNVALPGLGLVVSTSQLLKNLTIVAEGSEVHTRLNVYQSDLTPSTRQK